MCKDKYVLIMDDDTQELIINALLNLRDEKLNSWFFSHSPTWVIDKTINIP